MSEIIKPLFLDETGKAIVEALTQREMTKTRIAEINAAADAAKSGIETKTDEQVERITEVTALAEDVNQLKAENAELKGDLVKLKDNVLCTKVFTPNSDGVTFKSGYYANADGWVENPDYNSWFYNAKNGSIYVTGKISPNCDLIVFNGSVSSATFVERFRQSLNNLPKKENPLQTTENQIIVVSVPGNITGNDITFSHVTTYKESNECELYDKNTVGNALFKQIIYNESNTTRKDGYFTTAKGYEQYPDYNSFYFVADKEFDVWFPYVNNHSYLSLSVYNNDVALSGFITRVLKSENNLPTVENKMHIFAGSTIVVTTDYTHSEFTLFSTNYDSKTKGKVFLERLQANSFVVHMGEYSINLFRIINESINANNWNIGTLMKNGNVIVPQGTDMLGPILINDNTDYVGGVHGDEILDKLTVSINGITENNINNLYNIDGDCLRLSIKSKIFDEFTKAHTFDRFVNIIFENSKITVDTTYKAVANCVVRRATNGGLLAARNDIINSISFNNSYFSPAPTESVNNISPNNTLVTFFTKYGTVSVRNLKGTGTNYAGFLVVFANETPMRCKSYFDVLKTGTYNFSAGDEISGAFEILLN